MKLYKQHKLLLTPFNLDKFENNFDVGAREQRLEFDKWKDWGVIKNYYGQGRIPCALIKRFNPYFKYNRSTRNFEVTSDEPHYEISNADIFLNGAPFLDDTAAGLVRFIGLVALVIVHDKGGMLSYGGNEKIALPKGSYFAFLPKKYCRPSTLYTKDPFSFVWESDEEDDIYYRIAFNYAEAERLFILSCNSINPHDFPTDLPTINLFYKKEITERDRLEFDEDQLLFNSIEELIQRAKEIGILWEEDQVESILYMINLVNTALTTPESCLKFLAFIGPNLDNYTFNFFGGIEKVKEVCGVKEEQQYWDMQFLVLEKIEASLFFDGKDIYCTSSPFLDCFLIRYGIHHNRELLGIPTNNEELEL